MIDNVIITDNGTELYPNKIFDLVDEFINTVLNDPQDIYNNRIITGMFKYIYNNYIGDLLDNKSNYPKRNKYDDINLLDNLFNIYIQLCYKYNNIPTILEFSLFTGISRDIINDWKNNKRRELTPAYVHAVKSWYETCELSQVKEKDVKSIFLLKANYGYNDNLAAIPIESQNITIKTEQLPDLSEEVRQIAQKEID